MHYSRITASPSKTYSAASAVLLNELLKGTISIIIALRNIDRTMSAITPHPLSSEKETHLRSPISRQSILSARFSIVHPTRLRALRQALFSRDCIQLSIPAILYVIQNNLQYTAASNLDVATFQVTYQMKILTTAAFSVIMLRRRLSKTKWLALLLLAIGVGIVQIQSSSAPAHNAITSDSSSSSTAILTAIHTMSPLKGFLAVTAACMTSGLAGVYFELLIKPTSATSSNSATVPPKPQPDLWIRNTQLSLFSLIPAILPILFNGSSDGLGPIGRLMAAFANFNGWAIGTVLTQTFGGLVTAIVIRYSDNIM
jgi:UDP-sugar transporter A1/2/3